MENSTGTLFVVATPIGNLSDMVPRAVEVLQSVDVIAAEDTRRTGQLCGHFGISTRLMAYHDHNEKAQLEKLLGFLLAGKSVALVSDAGMPLISDPGYPLVKCIRERDVPVVVVPGPCALVVALAGAGLPADRFQFFGFPPHKQQARVKWLSALASHSETLVFYESCHRILATLQDIAEAFGSQRSICVARELTKQYETWLSGTVTEVISMVSGDANQQKGEFVLVVGGNPDLDVTDDVQISHYMQRLMEEVPIKKAAALTADLLGVKKNYCYQLGLDIQGRR